MCVLIKLMCWYHLYIIFLLVICFHTFRRHENSERSPIFVGSWRVNHKLRAHSNTKRGFPQSHSMEKESSSTQSLLLQGVLVIILFQITLLFREDTLSMALNQCKILMFISEIRELSYYVIILSLGGTASQLQEWVLKTSLWSITFSSMTVIGCIVVVENAQWQEEGRKIRSLMLCCRLG